MITVQVLELNKNKLEKIPGLTFHGLKNVKILKLRKNNLRYLDDGAFYGLDSIEQLYLDRNQVVTVNKGWLYGLRKLQVLSLSYNQVDYIEDDGWEFCEQVFRLNLQGNQLEIVERNILRTLPSLKYLNLRDNLISHIEAEDTFEEVPRLEELYLDGNQLSHTIEDTQAPFKHLDQLKVLGLARNNIKSIGSLALVGLEHIEELDFSDNIISTVQENPFAHLAELRTIKLNSSSLLCDCNLRWLAEFVNQTRARGVTGLCAHPENLKDRLVTSLESEMFTCEDFPKPYILVEPQSQIALRGKDLTLYCRAASTSPAQMNFVWKKDGTVVEEEECLDQRRCVEVRNIGLFYLINHYHHLQNIAHSFDGKGMEVTSELKLTNLTYRDIGAYQCIVENLYGATYSVKAEIQVYVFPQFVLTPEDKTVQGGTSVSLKCSATGVPKPDISWQKDSGSDFPAARERRLRVDPESNTYVITKVKAEDMGTYTCTATNLAGSITTNTSLTVLERPRFVKVMTNKTVRLGETAVLECQATGAPRPSLTWSKDGGHLVATERHFFTADNQLVIIVKVEVGDEGSYQCSMHNNLGTLTGTSHLTVTGGNRSVPPPHGTTSVIVIAVICCVIGTSAVWMFIICYSRARSRDKRRDWASHLEAVKDVETPTSGMPLLEADGGKNEDAVSERDSGTGDSKQSDNVETADSIVDTVIHNFLTARGEQAQWMLTSPYNTASLSDFDTGISSLGESGSLPPHISLQSLHRRGCPKVKLNPRGSRQVSKAGPESEVESEVVVSVSYAVDNPLYDSLPGPPGQREGPEEGSVCSSLSSGPSVPLSDLPLTFNTFQPERQTRRPRQQERRQRERLSVIELPTGETMLPIESQGPSEPPTNLEEDDVVLAAKEYRGGGTLPRHGLQQEWLEASLNYAESEARQEGRPREKGSRRSKFRSSRRSQAGSDRGSCHNVNSETEHSNVGSKGREMF